jgi:hypothetical protein
LYAESPTTRPSPRSGAIRWSIASNADPFAAGPGLSMAAPTNTGLTRPSAARRQGTPRLRVGAGAPEAAAGLAGGEFESEFGAGVDAVRRNDEQARVAEA